MGNRCEVPTNRTAGFIRVDMRTLSSGYYTLTIHSSLQAWHYALIKTE
jgi:hypothetical protein